MLMVDKAGGARWVIPLTNLDMFSSGLIYSVCVQSNIIFNIVNTAIFKFLSGMLMVDKAGGAHWVIPLTNLDMFSSGLIYSVCVQSNIIFNIVNTAIFKFLSGMLMVDKAGGARWVIPLTNLDMFSSGLIYSVCIESPCHSVQ